MEPEWTHTLLFVVAGILTGIINTVAGSGTIVSMGSMILFGIPIELANTTNRLGVFFQNVFGILSVRRHDSVRHMKIPLDQSISTLFGALAGAVAAAYISSESLNYIVLFVIIVMMIYTLRDILRPKQPDMRNGFLLPKWMSVLIFFSIGFYGGFLQIGVGILMLIGLRAINQLQWNTANYLKLVIILIYTVPTTLYFIYMDMIVWIPGFTLAFGQIIGAYAAGWLFSINPLLKRSIPYMVLLMLMITAVKIIID